MGLFDGVDPVLGLDPDYGSTAHVARLLAAPVVLVVDAARAGRSVAALARGFAGFDPRTPVAGVILNRVALGPARTAAAGRPRRQPDSRSTARSGGPGTSSRRPGTSA